MENIYSNFDILHRIMTTLDVLLPDLTVVPDALSMDRDVQGFLRVVRNLQEEINITDCKVYTALLGPSTRIYNSDSKCSRLVLAP